MLTDLLNKIREGNIFYGLDIVTVNGVPAYHLVSVLRKGDEIDLLTTGSFGTLEDVVRAIPKRSPVSLVLRTDQVITKKNAPSGPKDGQGIRDLFPAVSDADFHWELLEAKGTVYGGICRKEIVDPIIAELNSKKGFVCSWGLGKICVETLPQDIKGQYLALTGEDQVLDNRELPIAGRYVPAFSGALNLAAGLEPSQKSYRGQQRANRRDLWHHRYFKLGLTSLVGLILVLLLCNFLVFSHYYDRVNELQGLSRINTDQKESLLNLAGEVERKQRMIQEVLRSSSSRASYYMDRIAGGIPKNILLQRLEYQPLLKVAKDGRPLALDSDHIVITGDYNDNLALSGWIADLENLVFVKTVTIINLEKNESGPAFELDVDLIAEK